MFLDVRQEKLTCWPDPALTCQHLLEKEKLQIPSKLISQSKSCEKKEKPLKRLHDFI